MRKSKSAAIAILVMMAFVVLASDAYSQTGKTEKEAREVSLVENARKNGFKLTRENGVLYIQGIGVENPFTKRPLEGNYTLSYGCEKPQAIEDQDAAWTVGRSARISILCSEVYNPRVIVRRE